jgi:hypothetical protein
MTSIINADTSGGLKITSDTSGALDIQSAGTTKIAMDSSGNVDIVGTVTGAAFEPDGDTAAGDNAAIGYTSAEGLILTGQGSTNDVTIKNDADADVIEIPTGTTTVNFAGEAVFANQVRVFESPSTSAQGILFRNTFNVGATLFSTGAATSNQYIAWINGNGTVGSIAGNGSAVLYNTTSDYRLKNTIAPMTGALAKVALLKPVTFKWNVDGSDGEGFIAHEAQAVIPVCVNGEKDAVDDEGEPKYQGMDTSFLVATLTAAIQEQQVTIEALTARITALEAS